MEIGSFAGSVPEAEGSAKMVVAMRRRDMGIPWPLCIGHALVVLSALLDGRAREEMPRRLTVVNWLLLSVALIAATTWTLAKLGGNEAAIAGRYPVAAVDYLVETGFDSQKGYNSYNWGGYLIWRGLPVFVDGRADVYGDDFLHYYRRTFDLTHRWQQPLDEYDVDYVLTEHFSPLSNLLTASERWQLAYDDALASVFIRAETDG